MRSIMKAVALLLMMGLSTALTSEASAQAPANERIKFIGSAVSPEMEYLVSVSGMDAFSRSALETSEAFTARVNSMLSSWKGQKGFDTVSFDAEKMEVTITMVQFKAAEEVMADIEALSKKGKTTSDLKE